MFNKMTTRFSKFILTEIKCRNGNSAVCCDKDGSCTDGNDAWCCNGEFHCSHNGKKHAAQKSSDLCVTGKILQVSVKYYWKYMLLDMIEKSITYFPFFQSVL